MPLVNLHLLHISPALPLREALKVLSATEPAPLVLSIPVRWIITPNSVAGEGSSTSSPSPLLRTPWSLLVITSASNLPSSITSQLLDHFHLQVGVPSRLLQDWETKNQALLHPEPSAVAPLTGSLDNPRFGKSGQTIELTESLLQWIEQIKAAAPSNASWRTSAISMLNLLAFKPSPQSHANYLKYGKAFAEDIGEKRGGTAKLVGNVVYKDTEAPKLDRKWQEFALAHYPSLSHFADMVGSEDYQKVNLKYRVPSLEDTCILCTSEVLVEEMLAGDGEAGRAKL